MHLFHTSDWHLGQTFYQYSRDYEHQCFLDWLLEQVKEHQPDALCVAGDLFDTVNPSISSQKQLFEFLVELHQLAPDTQAILMAGNHDSGSRIEMPATVLAPLNCKVAGRLKWNDGQLLVDDLITPVIRHGVLKGYVVTLPFLRSVDLGPVHQMGYGDASQAVPDILRAVEQALAVKQAQLAEAVPITLMLHAHLRGGQSGDSEKKIVIGDSEAWPAHWLKPLWSYVALGHLHRPQKINQEDRIRYSGSPIPLSLSEINYKHQILNVKVTPQSLNIEPIYVPRVVPMIRLEQPTNLTLDEWLDKLSSHSFEMPSHIENRTWLELVLHLKEPLPADFMMRCEKILPADRVRLLRVQQYRKNDSNISADFLSSSEMAFHLPEPHELFRREWQKQFGEIPEALLKDFQTLLKDAEEAEENSQIKE